MEDNLVLIESFSSEIDARIASGYLESQGIDTYIEKDDCEGNLPLLQFSSGVRLFVNPDDERKARAILTEIQPEQASQQGIEIKKAPKKTITILITLVFVLGFSMGYILYPRIGVSQKTASVIETDTNGDNKPDVFSYYNKENLLRVEADRNYDGRIDIWYRYSNNRLTSGEPDDNFDGRIDCWAKYQNENTYEVQIDTDFNGQPDATIYFVHQLKARTDWHPNNSSVIERREVFEHGNKKEELIDSDRDGKFDLKILFDSFGKEVQRIKLKR